MGLRKKEDALFGRGMDRGGCDTEAEGLEGFPVCGGTLKPRSWASIGFEGLNKMSPAGGAPERPFALEGCARFWIF